MRHRIRQLRWPIVLVATAVLIGSGTAYAVTRDGSTDSYRTAVAARGDVEQTLSTSGTVDAARRADLEFATSGTVARVAVALGDKVKAGQVVARLDTEELEAAVTRAEAVLARARAQLEADRAAQDETVAGVTTPASSTPKDSTTPDQPAADGNAAAAALAALRDQQDAVIAAQSGASAAITAAKEALATQTQTCADAYQKPAEADPGQDQAQEEVQGGEAPADLACAEALATVQARQDEVSAAQDDLAQALAALADTLTKAIGALAADSSGTTGTTPSSAAPDSATPSSTTPSTANPDGATGTVSAARLAADQAAIEQAEADLVEARQQRRQAVVRSTRAGRVVSLPAEVGAEVAAGDPAAVVVGGKAVTIQAVVSESKIGQVDVGQPVRVTVPGTTGTADGTVSAIGLVADSSSGTASYPVTVTVEEPAISLPAGSRALLAIVVSTASDVVAVPTSAVTRRDDAASVQVWDGEALSQKTVTLGVVGARTVEVTDGLDAGERVVLADLDAAVTDAADSINDRGGFGGVPVFRTGSGPGGPPANFQRAN